VVVVVLAKSDRRLTLLRLVATAVMVFLQILQVLQFSVLVAVVEDLGIFLVTPVVLPALVAPVVVGLVPASYLLSVPLD
jgi:hypothetical protein